MWSTALLGALLLGAPSTSTEPPAPDPLAALERQQQSLFSAAAPSVVFIRTTEGMGSGFFVSEDGLVLTNRHVVGEDKSVEVFLHDGRRSRGKVVELAEDDVDLALVDVDIRHSRPLPFADLRSLGVGAWAAAIGHGEGAIWTFNTGMISNIYPPDSLPVVQTQIPLNPGNSGGPILDRKGRVVGVVTAGIQWAQSINFAIRIDEAIKVLPKLRAHCNCLTIHAPKGIPVFLDGELAGHGPTVAVVVDEGPHEVVAVLGGKRRSVRVRTPGTREIALSL